MARPQKNNADYFSHDNDMRNDEKIKAIRNKFKSDWYSCWNMLLEKLCKADNFRLEYSELNIELWWWDFDIDSEKVKEIIDYFLKIKLLFLDWNMIFSEKLIKRFDWLLCKRERQKKWLSTKEMRENDIIDVDNEIKDVDNTQSKVKYSKVNKSKVNISKDILNIESNKINENSINNTYIFFNFLNKYEKSWKLEEEDILKIKEITKWILEWEELLKFYNYRAEKNKSWKMRWELEKTFEIHRRLLKWKSWIKEKIESKQKPIVEY